MINVLVVDDSQVVRDLLTYIIETDSQLKVIGHAENGKKALEFLQHHKPDVITMDILMPLLDGFEVTRTIMQTKPIPIIIISGLYASENVEQSFKAIEAGALAILEKPMGIGDIQYRQKAAMIIKMIKIVSEIKLVTRTRSTQYPAHSMGNSTETIPSRLKTTNQSCAIKAVAIGAKWRKRASWMRICGL